MLVSINPGRELRNLFTGVPYPVRQSLLGIAYLLAPKRLPNLLPMATLALRDLPYLGRPAPVPCPDRALNRPDGLCGLAGQLDVPSLLDGYSKGLFVMSHLGPLKWWAPRQRMVLFFDQARVEKAARRLLRNGTVQVTFDHAFEDVMRACASPRPGHTPLTWITPRMRAIFLEAHKAGYAHSVEVWRDGQLVGGAYGLAVGRVFFTESQFHIARDASKVAFAVLNRHLQTWRFALNDAKHHTEYLAASGCRLLPRDEFTSLVQLNSALPGRVGPWQVDPGLLGGDWEPETAPGIRIADLLPEGSRYDRMSPDMLRAERSNTW